MNEAPISSMNQEVSFALPEEIEPDVKERLLVLLAKRRDGNITGEECKELSYIFRDEIGHGFFWEGVALDRKIPTHMLSYTTCNYDYGKGKGYVDRRVFSCLMCQSACNRDELTQAEVDAWLAEHRPHTNGKVLQLAVHARSKKRHTLGELLVPEGYIPWPEPATNEEAKPE